MYIDNTSSLWINNLFATLGYKGKKEAGLKQASKATIVGGCFDVQHEKEYGHEYMFIEIFWENYNSNGNMRLIKD